MDETKCANDGWHFLVVEPVLLHAICKFGNWVISWFQIDEFGIDQRTNNPHLYIS